MNCFFSSTEPYPANHLILSFNLVSLQIKHENERHFFDIEQEIEKNKNIF